jgi:chemotaxis signal transduction protein
MDAPHQRIHAAADEVLQWVERGDVKGAQELLAAKRSGELAELSKLFEETRRILLEHHRELAVVLMRGEKRFAISIDLVEAVERISEENIKPMSPVLAERGNRHQWRIGKRSKTNQPILLLDEDFLYSSGAAN